MSTFEQVKNWNLICAKPAPKFGSSEYYEALENQAARIAEELEELQEAISFRQVVTESLDTGKPFEDETGVERVATQEDLGHYDQEILDAGCDLDVVVSGLNFMAGHNYGGAIQAVLDNNSLKHTHILAKAEEALAKYGDGHRIEDVGVEIEQSGDVAVTVEVLTDNGYEAYEEDDKIWVRIYSVHRDSDDKICKLIDHPSVDLKPFLNLGK